MPALLASRAAWRRFALLAVVVVSAFGARAAWVLPPASATTTATQPAAVTLPDRNAERARATYATIDRDFRSSSGNFREVYPADDTAYATLWPLSQTLVGVLSLSGMPDQTPAVAAPTLAAFDPYWDATVSPAGYAASVRPPLGSGDRKFFDDNGWTGLALMQAYRLSGDPALLARAQQVFAFAISGWDADPSHPAPGGIWWSQQMPNPRFIHRNTVSTASNAELGLELYAATGRSEPMYLDWATRMYTWVDTYLRGPNGLYGDHVDLNGVVDPGQLSYNQGTMVGAAVQLYRITRDPAYLERARSVADTSLTVFGPDFNQPPAYNAVFFRNLLRLGAETNDPRYRAAMQAYADQVWDTLRNPDSGLFDFAYGRNRTAEPHRLLDQGAMLQIYAALALGPSAPDMLT